MHANGKLAVKSANVAAVESDGRGVITLGRRAFASRLHDPARPLSTNSPILKSKKLGVAFQGGLKAKASCRSQPV